MKISAIFQNLNVQGQQTFANRSAANSTSGTSAAFSGENAEALNTLFSKYNQTPDTDTVSSVESFMKTAQGSTDSKLETVETALYKGIEMTPGNLNAVHSALNDDGEMLKVLTAPNEDEATVDKKAETLLKFSDFLQLPERVKRAILESLTQFSELRADGSASGELSEQAAGQALETLASVLGTTDVQSLLESLGLKTIQAEDLSASDLLTVIQTLLTAESDSETVLSTVAETMEATVADAVLFDAAPKVKETGHRKTEDASIERSGSDEAVDKTDAEKLNENDGETVKIKPITERQSETMADSKDTASGQTEGDAINEASEIHSEVRPEKAVDDTDEESIENLVLAAIDQVFGMAGDTLQALDVQVDIKQYLVETTTEATIQAKNDFSAFQKSVDTLLTVEPESSNEDVYEALSKTIEKLDRLILKSTVGLFTDMYQEKTLLQSGARLEEARSALESGATNKAMALIETVKSDIGGIVFKPSESRLQLFASFQLSEASAAVDSESPEKLALDTEIKKMLEWYKDSSGVRQSRDVMEIVRFMGGNHEAEVVEALETPNSKKNQDWGQGNVKEMLLRLMKENTENRTVEAQTMSLTGQQMMNQQDQQGRRQFHFFNLPFEDGETVGNMKVYLQGNQSGERLDYKNTELYFAMNLNRLGETGIRVKVASGVCDVTVMNETPEVLRETFESLFEELGAMGIEPGNLRFETTVSRTSLGREMAQDSAQESAQQIGKSPYAYQPEKGFDYTI